MSGCGHFPALQSRRCKKRRHWCILPACNGRAVEGGPDAVVIDTEAAAEVDVLNGKTHFVKACSRTAASWTAFFDGENVRQMRADVKNGSALKQCARGSDLSISTAASSSTVLSRTEHFAPMVGQFRRLCERATGCRWRFDSELPRTR